MRHFIPTFLLAVVSCSGLLAAVSDSANPEVSLQGNGFALIASNPQVVILEAKETPPITLGTREGADVKRSKRQTPGGPAAVTTFAWSDPRGFKYSWTLTRLENLPGVTVQMTFENNTSKPVHLREFVLLQNSSAGLTVTGDPKDWWMSTLDSHDSATGGFHPSGDLATLGERQFLDSMTLYTARGAKGLLMGATGPAVSDVRFFCQIEKGGVGLKVTSEMNDVIVDPGETRCSEEVLLLDQPFDKAAPELFRWLAASHGSRTARGPLTGWCSWYGKGKNIDAKFIGEVCESVQANRDRIPLDVIQIDDGWQKAYGDWEVDRNKFPDGMKAVADQIRAAGAIPGIWLCPVRSSKEGAHPDGQANEYLDPSDPAVQAFVRKALTDRVAEGYRYFKLDFLWVRDLKTRHDWKKTRLEIARDIYKVYRESIGEESYLLACVGGFNRACFGFADAARIGTDTSGSMKNLYVGCCLADCINATGTTALSAGILFANDPDVTYLRIGTKPLLRTWYSYVGLLGGIAMTSEPLPALDGAALRNFERLIPPAPDKGRAFDGQTDPWHRQFGFVAQRPWGNFASVLLWNPDNQPADLPLKGVPLEALGGKFHVWSFWDEKYLGVSDESFVAESIPVQGPALLRLSQVADNLPVLVGSNLHIGMGSAEIKDIQATPQGMTITLTDAGARDGKLYVHSTRPLTLASAQGCQASVAPAGENIYCVTLAGRQRNSPNVISLK